MFTWFEALILLQTPRTICCCGLECWLAVGVLAERFPLMEDSQLYKQIVGFPFMGILKTWLYMALNNLL